MWLDNIILTIEVYVTHNLHRDFFLFIFRDQDDSYILCFLFADGDLEDKRKIIALLFGHDLDEVHLIVEIEVEVIDRCFFIIECLLKILDRL